MGILSLLSSFISKPLNASGAVYSVEWQDPRNAAVCFQASMTFKFSGLGGFPLPLLRVAVTAFILAGRLPYREPRECFKMLCFTSKMGDICSARIPSITAKIPTRWSWSPPWAPYQYGFNCSSVHFHPKHDSVRTKQPLFLNRPCQSFQLPEYSTSRGF